MALLNKDNETNIQALALDLARAENEEAFAKAQVALAAQIEQDIIAQAKQAATDVACFAPFFNRSASCKHL